MLGGKKVGSHWLGFQHVHERDSYRYLVLFVSLDYGTDDQAFLPTLQIHSFYKQSVFLSQPQYAYDFSNLSFTLSL